MRYADGRNGGTMLSTSWVHFDHRRLSLTTFVSAMIVIMLAGVTLTAAPANAARDDRAVVVRVIDGDTVALRIDGTETRVRLLNIDTPETKDPNEPVECLGPEASEYLTTLLPVGAKVTLQYDEQRFDRYGRTLAAVYTSDDKFVSAEIARQGFGMAVAFGRNDKNYKTVLAAQKTAQTKFRGLYSKSVDCTIRTQVKALKAETQQLAAAETASAPASELTVLVAESVALLAGIAALQQLADLDQPPIAMAILLGTPKIGYAKGLRNMETKATAVHAILTEAENAAIGREAAAAAQALADADAAAAAEAAAAAAAAAEQAAADAQATADANAAAEQRAAQSQPDAEPYVEPYVEPDVEPYVEPFVEPYVEPAEEPAVEPAAPEVDNYTGCRAYGKDGTSFDDQGRPYTKIPCP
jgi:micrococcal nuclease